MSVRVITGDALTELRRLPDESVDFALSSPPYWGLRSYLPEGHPDKALEIGSARARISRDAGLFFEVAAE